MRLASWASTRRRSSSRGCSMAAWMAAGVISWKTIRMHRDPGREHLGEVPGDRLALAVLVCREVDLARLADEAAELGHLFALLRATRRRAA